MKQLNRWWCALLLCAAHGVLAQGAGTIDFLQGQAGITAADGQRRAAALGGRINPGDMLDTGAASELHVVMADGGMLALRADSQVRIDAFRAENDARDESKIALLKGALRAVTGWLAKSNPRAYAVATATATIGVRGTDFEVILMPPGTGDAGAHVRVHDGGTVLRNGTGEQNINAGGSGYAPEGSAPPRLHERIPDFIERAKGANDERVARHNGEIGRHMDDALRRGGKLREGESSDRFIERARGENERRDGARDGKGDGQRDAKGARGERMQRPERPERPERPRRPGQY